MKKHVWVAVLMLCAFSAAAQEYKPVKVGLGLGYASPAGEGSKGGVLLYLEPAYRINDQIAVGLRLELAAMARVAVVGDASGGSADAEVSANGSYTLNGQYYFLNGTFRPYAGLGVGLFSMASATVSSSTSGSGSASTEVSGDQKIGFYPRLGFDLGHFSMNLEYNIIPKTESTVVVVDGNGTTSTATSTVQNSYLGIKLGFFIGGGRK